MIRAAVLTQALVVWPRLALATIAIVGAPLSNSNSGSTTSIDCPAATYTTGDLIFVVGEWGSATITATVSDTVNRYNTANPILTVASSGHSQQTYYAAGIRGGSLTVTLNFSRPVSNVRVACFQVSGLAPNRPLDQVAFNSGTSGNPSFKASGVA